MKNTIKLGLFVILLFLSTSSRANKFCKTETIKKIESYIDSLSKVGISFIQKHPQDDDVKGLLLIEKPMKFRVNYDAPHPFVIAGGKNFVSIYDYSLDELSRIDAQDNLFRFLLEFNTNIEKTVKILGCTHNQEEIIFDLMHIDTEQKAMIIFSSSPVKIKKLTIPDDGTNYGKGKVEMEFLDIYHFNNINKDLFILKEPKIYGKANRFSSKEIIEKLSAK